MYVVINLAKRNKKNETIYCVFCGEENAATASQCKKCKKDLHPKNQLFKDFLYDHIKDDLKGKVKDSIFSYLKNFIISHLYGAAMTVSLVFTATAIIVSPKGTYKTVNSISEVNQPKTSNSKEIVATIYTYDDSCDGDFPEELRDVPFPFAGYVVSGRKKTAIEITFKKGESIDDWCNNGHEEDIICHAPLYLYDSKVDKQAKEYRDKFYEYAAWYHENGTSNDDEYSRRADEVDTLAYELLYENNLTTYDTSKAINKSVDLFISEVGCEH